MSQKKQRAWFVCRSWPDLVSKHYADDAGAGRSLGLDRRVLVKLRAGTPVAKSTMLKALRSYAGRHEPGLRVAELISDTRAH